MKISVGQAAARDLVAEHRDVFTAIESKDAEAARAFMAALIANALKDTRLALKDGAAKPLKAAR